MTDYSNRIHFDLVQYHCRHYGRLPKFIFMSSELFYRLVARPDDLQYYYTHDETVAMFHHVPVRVYSSGKLEYYFVESGGEFD